MEQEKQKVIVIVAMPHTLLLDIAGPSDVFSVANRNIGDGNLLDFLGYKIVVTSPHNVRSVKTRSGISVVVDENLYKLDPAQIDTLLIAGFSAKDTIEANQLFIEWLQENSNKIRRIGSICRGAFILAAAGFLDGMTATTHWEFCDDLQRCYPKVNVDPDPIFIKNGKIYTAAGVSSGIDLSLAMLEEDCGRDIALKVARQLVLYLKRPGNQSQFSMLLPNSFSNYKAFGTLQKWILENLNRPFNVEQMAEFCSMSPRNFARVFQRELKMPPGKYIEKLRVESARRKLEETYLSIEQIAEECGVGSADTLRRLFLRHLKISPNHYRRSFRTALEQELPEMV
jgi:transcriptional regulator GlxA family with amidase domain